MQKIIITLFLALTSILYGYSQEKKEKFAIPQGTWLTGGSLSFSTYNNKKNNNDGTTNNIGFYPKLGYMINNNLELGVSLGYSYSNSEQDSYSYNDKRNDYSISPYIKRYFPIGKKLAFHSRFGAAYNKTETKREHKENTDNSKYHHNSFSINLRPGFTYSLTEKFVMYTNIGSLSYVNGESGSTGSDDLKFNRFGFDLSTSDIQWGIIILL